MGSTGVSGDAAFHDDFDGPGLDTAVWVPHYLPMWSSRAESAATYTVGDSELRLSIPPEQGLWCPGDHDPLRVSGIQSGVFSGPVGSTTGQQPVRLDYTDPMMRKATAVVPKIDDVPCDRIADWGNANSSACTACVQNLSTSSCGSFSRCSVFESDCIDKALATPSGSVCTVAKSCNVSANCSDDVGKLAACMASTCAADCE